jgi:tRNA G18 (ribose-2'-O)-methylase SpoU
VVPIEREDDPRLEPYRHVGDPAWLLAQGLFVAEGRLVVERLFAPAAADGGYGVDSVLVTPPAFRALEPTLSGFANVLIAAPAIVNAVTGFNFHRGCLALVRRPPPASLAPVLDAARRVVVLEGVGNPDNVGGIFRSAAAFGADAVLLDPASGDPFYRKALRTSVGAVLRLPFARLTPWPGALDRLAERRFAILGLTPSGSRTIDEVAGSLAPGSRIALLAGAEGPGLSAAALSNTSATVRIPVDPRSDSLNVVVAVSIALQRLSDR